MNNRSVALPLLVLLGTFFGTSLACTYAKTPVVLEVSPEHICTGDAVTLRYVAVTEGPYRLSSTMDRYSPPSPEQTISDTVTVNQRDLSSDSTVTFTFSAGRTTVSKVVTALRPGGASTLDLVFRPECDASCGPPSWQSALGPEDWSPNIHIDSVSNANDRSVTVGFAGITHTLSAGELSTAWSGRGLLGTWTVKSALRSATPPAEMYFEECCEHVGRAFNPSNTAHRPPPDLTLMLRYRCP